MMPKRFHDTAIWEEDWFIDLPKDYRSLWFYILDTCDHAGIWRPNVAKFNKLFDCQTILNEALKLFNKDKDRILVAKNGRWFLRQFIPFQYGGHLNINNRVHNSVLSVLKHNEVNLRGIRGQFDPIEGVKEKDKEKDKEKERNKEGFDFEKIWKQYPNRVGRKEALRHFKASVKTEQDLKDIQKSLDNYKKSKNVLDGFIQGGSRWFNEWRDWIDYKEPEKFDPIKENARINRERSKELIERQKSGKGGLPPGMTSIKDVVAKFKEKELENENT